MTRSNETLCAIFYILCNLKNVINTHLEVLLFATLFKVTLLHGCFSRFLISVAGTKSRKASQTIFTESEAFSEHSQTSKGFLQKWRFSTVNYLRKRRYHWTLTTSLSIFKWYFNHIGHDFVSFVVLFSGWIEKSGVAKSLKCFVFSKFFI